jgi:uncharacterized protein (TIGR02145 family)
MGSSVIVKIRLGIFSFLSVILLISCTKEVVVNDPFDGQFEQFTDSRDGHVYNLIKIGDQTWMAENLSYLPQINTPDQLSETEERYYVYGFNGSDVNDAVATKNYKNYGVLYNWLAANNSCPEGWHLPTKVEWDVFIAYLTTSLGTSKSDSLAFTIATPFGWKDYYSKDSIDVDKTGRNSTLFSALPGGYLYYDGIFYSEGNSAFWWTAQNSSVNDAAGYILTNSNQQLFSFDFNKEAGFSVRCVKD